MDSPSPSRFCYQEADEYQSAEEAMEVLADSESEGYELESMTGKGINRLCLELLELKKASDENFQKNIYSNYSAFLRIFEEFPGVESEIMKIKNCVSTQNMLLEELMNSFHSEIIMEKLENMKDECVEDLELDFPSWTETRLQNILETLDIFMSEHRMEEALVILEKEIQTLQKLQKEKDGLLPAISPFAYAIFEWRTRLAEHFALLAGHRRVTWPELYNTLFGLCRLGESDRASVILLNFYDLQLESTVNELRCSVPFSHGTYTLELTKVVFSIISQAARSFVVLFGEASPYTLDLMQWARVKLEVICYSLDMSVKSISETSFTLGLAVETMNISFSFCSLLEHKGLGLQSDVIKLMKPCMAEVLRMHFDQLRKVVSLFVSTDNWVLGKFLSSGKSSNKSTLIQINEKLEYLQLTSSGRKLITLIQMVLDDTFSFHAFHLETLILKGLSDLFDEYTINLERAIRIKERVEECDFPLTISAQKLHQQVSILVNIFVLEHLLPTIVQSSFDVTFFASDVVLLEDDKLSSLNELDFWKKAIHEASDRLKSCFCQLFVSGMMSHGNSESMKDLDTCVCGYCLQGSSDDPMPSFVFQELFVRLRRLEEQFGFILLVEDGMMNNLFNGIMMTVIFWLSENWEYLQTTKSHKQLLLDVHFLMEIARVGGYFSDNLMAAALDLMAIMKRELTTEEFHLNSEISEESRASTAAKLAIKTLLDTGKAETKSKYTPTVDHLNKYTEDNHKGTQERMDESKVNQEVVLGTGDSIVTMDGGFFHSLEYSAKLKTQNPKTGAIDFYHHDEGSSSQTIFNSCIEVEQAVAGTISDKLSEINSIELNMGEFFIISEPEYARNPDLGTTALREIGELTGISESETNRIQIQLLGVLEKLEPNGNLEHQDGSVDISILSVSDAENFAQVIGSPSDSLTGAVLQTEGVTNCTEVTESCVLIATEEDFQFDSYGERELSKSEVQHSKKKFSTENTQNDGIEVEHEMNTGWFELKILTNYEKDFPQEIICKDECSEADPTAIAKNNTWHLLDKNGEVEKPKHAKAGNRFKNSKDVERHNKYGQAADGIRKNKKEKSTRPQWQ